MAGITTMRDKPEVKELLEVLANPGLQTHRNEYESLLDGVDAIIKQYDSILTELDVLKKKINSVTDRKSPLAVMVERIDALSDNIRDRLDDVKNRITSFTNEALNMVKEKGLSALGAMFRFLHVKDGLQTVCDSLTKSVDALNNTIARVSSLEQHNREKAIVNDAAESVPVRDNDVEPGSLAELMGDVRLDFENQSPDELQEVYKTMLEIGMNNELSANENICLSSMVDEVGAMMPEYERNDQAMEAEAVEEQDAEI